MNKNQPSLRRLCTGGLGFALFAILNLAAARPGESASFTPVDVPFNGILSGDGSTIAGQLPSGAPFIWDAENGITGLTGFVGAGEVRRISSDGSRLVGFTDHVDPSENEVYTWDVNEGTRIIRRIPDSVPNFSFLSNLDHLSDVSLDGSTVVGAYRPGLPADTSRRPFIWDTQENRIDNLRDLVDGTISIRGIRLSEDGSILAAANSQGALLWNTTNRATDPAEPIQIPGLLGPDIALSADGSTLVGSAHFRQGFPGSNDFIMGEASIWTAATGLETLPSREEGTTATLGEVAFRFGGTGMRTVVVSDDGSTVAGRSEQVRNGPSSSDTAVVWDDIHGTQALKLRLAMLGIDLDGWQLTEVVDISADGRTLFGNGINPDGVAVGFLAVIPEPGTATLISLGLMGLAIRPRKAVGHIGVRAERGTASP